MIIRKEQIGSKEIREQIDRYGHMAKKSIIEMNKQLPKDRKLNKEVIEVEKTKCKVLIDNNIGCSGYLYKITWTYTNRNETVINESINRSINSAVFILKCLNAAPYLDNFIII